MSEGPSRGTQSVDVRFGAIGPESKGWPRKRIRSPKVPRLERQSASVSYADFEPGSGCRASKVSVAVSEYRRLSGGNLPVV
jgi:hypothetical protein